MARTDFRHVVRLRVRWAEVDSQSVVFNGHYLLYADVCVTEYWRTIGLRYPDRLEGGVDLYVVKSTVEYHLSARYDDELELCGRIARIGHTSLQFLIEMHRGAEHVASAELIYVSTDAGTRRPVPVPGAMRDRITAYEVVPPECTPPRASPPVGGPHA